MLQSVAHNMAAVMRRWFFFAFALSISSATVAQVAPPAPQTVEVSSGSLRLQGFLWKPQGPGPFPAVVFNHGRSDTPQQHTLQLKLTLEHAAQVLGPVFIRHGFVFLYPFRRGEGPSANRGNSLVICSSTRRQQEEPKHASICR